MEKNKSNQSDASLHEVLKEWKAQPPLPPRFQEEVWRRIERADTAPSVSLAEVFAKWIANTLQRPALATAYVSVLFVIGAGVGWNQAQQETARVTGGLSARYVQSVDPYQANP